VKKNKRPALGIFDSGVGGLSVFQHAVRAFPCSDIYYLADTARYPYGEKTESDVMRYITEILTFFRKSGADAVIMACSTASSVYRRMKGPEIAFPFPVVTMLNECLWKEVAHRSGLRRTGILSTTLTRKVNQFAEYLKENIRDISVYINSAPELVELVTQGKTEDTAAYETARRYLEPLMAQGVDALVIGCTHFHFIVDVLSHLCGDKISLIEPAPLSVKHLKSLGFCSSEDPSSHPGDRKIVFYVTGRVEDFYQQACRTVRLEYPPGLYRPVELPAVLTETTI
jgi:glutamate racemase